MGVTFCYDKTWALALTPTREQLFPFLHYFRTGNVPNAVAVAQIKDP
jgi:hypothetical protein